MTHDTRALVLRTSASRRLIEGVNCAALPALHRVRRHRMAVSDSDEELNELCERRRAIGAAPKRTAPVLRLPRELFVQVVIQLLEMEQALHPIATVSRVCRRFFELVQDDFVWSHVARNYFVAYPLLRSFMSPVGPRPSTPVTPVAAVPPLPDGGVVYRGRVGSSDARRLPTMRSVLKGRREVAQYLSQREHMQRVAERRRYVLHVFLSFTLLCVFLSLTCFTFALEGVGPADTFSLSNGFNFMWASFVLVYATIVTNIVMQAHFDPHPIFVRIHRHFGLIAQSVAMLAGMLVTVALPLGMVQHNTVGAGRWTTAECVLPPCIGALAWQLRIIAWFRTDIARWWRQGGRLGFSSLYHAAANSTPLYLAVTLGSVAAYIETGAYGFVALAAVLPFVSLVTLAVIFSVDFATRGNAMDGLASVCLFGSSACPLLFIVGIQRGYTLFPVAMAALLFFAAHLAELRKLFLSVDELDVLVATGAADD